MNNFDNMQCLNTAFSTGAFLTSKENVMVASWGFVGVMWGKKVFIAPVRDTRFTKEFIDSTGCFTVSVPHEGQMLDAIKFCGTKSGRDFDKWAETGLNKQKAKSCDSVVVEGCRCYFECKVICCIPMQDMNIEGIEKWYPTPNKHNFYFAEIVEEY